MALPVTNLAASWSTSPGISLSWTAATDVTNQSKYAIYFLNNVLSSIPYWDLIGVSSPYAFTALEPGSLILATVTILPPTTSYVIPTTQVQALFGAGYQVAPNSLALRVVHIDSTGAQSDPAGISVFMSASRTSFGAPHLPNNIAIDNMGQFIVNTQDSYAEISDSVEMILTTIEGQRTMVPDFGTPDLPMNQIDLNEVIQAIDKWEPRANAVVSVVYDDNNNASLSVRVLGGD